VRPRRFNPVPWLTIVTLTPGITAPVGSAMVPETVASCVCDHAPTEKSTVNDADSMRRRHDARFAPEGGRTSLFVTWGRPAIKSVSFFVIAPLNLGQTAYSRALRRGHAHHFFCGAWKLNNRKCGHECVPGRLSHQYVCGSVHVRRDPTTLRERRCHNCRPTKMTCSPVNFGRVDTTNLAQFAYSRTESNYTGRSSTRENKNANQYQSVDRDHCPMAAH